MIFNRPLTFEEKKSSRHNYSLYNIVNGASYMCLGETVLILLAVQLKCSDTVVAILGSMQYVGFLLLPLGKIMTARTGAAGSQAQFWVYRNLAVLIVLKLTCKGYVTRSINRCSCQVKTCKLSARSCAGSSL